MDHSIRLRSVENARELGGYNADGKTVKRGVLLRTASLSAISQEDRETLESVYRISTIVDLRMSSEREQAPDPTLSGVENRFLPVLELEDYPGYDAKLAEKYLVPGVDRLTLLKTSYELGILSDRLYVSFLFSERGKTAYRTLFDCLLTLPNGRACLWHCTDGKDRTGIASMLILTALGADRETIMEDYLLTNAYNAEKIRAVR